VKPRVGVKSAKLSKLMLAPITPSSSQKFDWPTRTDIESIQQASKDHVPNRFELVDGLFQDYEEIVWIPSRGADP